MRLRFLIAFLLIAFPALATDYYVDGNLAGNCAGGAGTSYRVANRDCGGSDGTKAYKTIPGVNAVLVAGETAWIRAGTYYVTGPTSACTGIKPANSGASSVAMITYSGYASETAIISGALGDTGYNSRGIYLLNKSYVKITKLTFQHLATWLMIDGGGHHEISYCNFIDQREPWTEKLWQSGTATADDPTGVTLTHADVPGSTYNGYYLFNTTDKSACILGGSSTTSTKVCLGPDPHLRFGTTNQWHIGDSYEIRATRALYGYGGAYVYHSTTHNWIHHNLFRNYGGFTWDDEGVCLQVGTETVATDISSNNTVENNELYNCGHQSLGIHSGFKDVVRRNYLHNEAWFSDAGMYSAATPPTNLKGCAGHTNGLCGYRVLYAVYGGKHLFEDNKIAYGAVGGPNMNTGNSGSGTSLASSDNIYRYNDHYGNSLYGIRLAASYSSGAGNHLYNNTLYHNGFGTPDEEVNYDPTLPNDYRNGLYLLATDTCSTTGTVIKNNLFYDNFATTATPSRTPIYYFNNVSACNQNYGQSADGTDPKFSDTTLCSSGPCTDQTKPALTLQATSPVIDQAVPLTTASPAGNATTTLIVADAKFFQDGTWGSDLAPVEADWIAVGTVTNKARISSVDWTTNTITLASPLTWADNASVWLYSDSSGTRVLIGSAPDYGAHEYSPDLGGGDVTAPVISAVTSGSISVSGATITWTTDENANSRVEIGTDTNYSLAPATSQTLTQAHSLVVAGLLSGTTYHYRVKSEDAAGNLATGSDMTLTTGAYKQNKLRIR